MYILVKITYKASTWYVFYVKRIVNKNKVILKTVLTLSYFYYVNSKLFTFPSQISFGFTKQFCIIDGSMKLIEMGQEIANYYFVEQFLKQNAHRRSQNMCKESGFYNAFYPVQQMFLQLKDTAKQIGLKITWRSGRLSLVMKYNKSPLLYKVAYNIFFQLAKNFAKCTTRLGFMVSLSLYWR